jgi:hypothetical protein
MTAFRQVLAGPDAGSRDRSVRLAVAVAVAGGSHADMRRCDGCNETPLHKVRHPSVAEFALRQESTITWCYPSQPADSAVRHSEDRQVTDW